MARIEIVSHGCTLEDAGELCACPDIRECGNAYPICGYGNCHLAENSCPACQGAI